MDLGSGSGSCLSVIHLLIFLQQVLPDIGLLDAFDHVLDRVFYHSHTPQFLPLKGDFLDTVLLEDIPELFGVLVDFREGASVDVGEDAVLVGCRGQGAVGKG